LSCNAQIKLENKFCNKTIKNWGFNINYKWVQGFLFEGSPQFTGFIPTYDMVDAQINYRIPKWYTTFKVGATNLFNNKRAQTYGGPEIGRLGYVSIVFEFDKI
jgi:outer membrane receptor protein involved in Fe transport